MSSIIWRSAGRVVLAAFAVAVLSPGVHVHSFAEVEDSILFPGADVARSATVRRAILDKDVRVLEGAQVGVDPETDRARGFAVSAGGVTVVGNGEVVEP